MVTAVLFVTCLLIAGTALRLRFTLFRWLYIPASVIAGAIGLLLLQSTRIYGQFASPLDPIPAVGQSLAGTLEAWPGWLIAVVFAGMLLERKPSPLGKALPRVARQGLMVWVIVLGQTAVGLAATWLLITPFYDVPNSLGMLIETGFAGGHGTAAAMGQVFAHPDIGLDAGFDLGVLMATCGLVYGVVSGVFWINVAVRAGWVKSETSEAADLDTAGGNPSPRPIGYARVGGETLDPLLYQILWLMLAFGIGMGLQVAVAEIAGQFDAWFLTPEPADAADSAPSARLTFTRLFGEFPLFIYTLFGGLIVRIGLRSIGQSDSLDHDTINRLTSAAMDVLVVAAVASLNLTAVINLLVPFVMLFLAGIAWSTLCLLVFAKWILPRDYWFQLGLINYGMSTGTTATGFVLLKVIDPELESGAAEDYALAAPISSPFVGGGVVTIGLPLLVLERVPLWSSCLVIALIVVTLIAIGKRWNAAENSDRNG